MKFNQDKVSEKIKLPLLNEKIFSNIQGKITSVDINRKRINIDGFPFGYKGNDVGFKNYNIKIDEKTEIVFMIPGQVTDNEQPAKFENIRPGDNAIIYFDLEIKEKGTNLTAGKINILLPKYFSGIVMEKTEDSLKIKENIGQYKITPRSYNVSIDSNTKYNSQDLSAFPKDNQLSNVNPKELADKIVEKEISWDDIKVGSIVTVESASPIPRDGNSFLATKIKLTIWPQ